MAFLMIPADYEETSSRIVPICIRTEDDRGNRIADGWIQGVVRVASNIRQLARTVLFDEWRSSELADETLQELWATHGDAVGYRPHSRVYAHAKWKALDKRAGGTRARKGMESDLLEHILASLRDPHNWESEVECREFLIRLQERLSELGLEDVNLALRSAMFDEGELKITPRPGESRNTASQRFWRQVRRAAQLL
jgi:hypothetical protein